MRDEARNRLKAAAAVISDLLAIEPPLLPERHRDAEYQHAAELTALAAWTEGVAASLTLTPAQLTAERIADAELPTTLNKKSGR